MHATFIVTRPDACTGADDFGNAVLTRSPVRTAAVLGFATWVIVPFLAGASDRIFVSFDVGYELQVTVMRVAWVVAPAVVFLIALRVCRRLRSSGERPLRGWDGTVLERSESGGFRPRAGRE